MGEQGVYHESALGRPRRCVHCGGEVGWERLLCPRCGRPADARSPSKSRARWAVASNLLQLAFWLAFGGWVLHAILGRVGPGSPP